MLEHLPIIIEDLPELPELEFLGKNKYGQPELERLVLDDNDKPALDKDGKPYFSAQSNGLQFQNQLSLWQIFRDSGVKVPRGPWLDAGCGRGLFFALAPHLLYSNPQIGRPHIIGVDMGHENTMDARAVARHVQKAHHRQTISPERPNGFNATIDVLKPQKLQEYTHSVKSLRSDGKVDAPLPLVAVVWSNQVFHWIKSDGEKYTTLERLYSYMKPGAVLCVSMSTVGTGKHFLQAYGEVIQGLGIFRLPDHREGYKRALFEVDPIGSQDLDKMATMIEDMGFELRAGFARRETVRYANPLQYAEAVRRYGFDIFMRSVSHRTKEDREIIWTNIEQRFLEVLKNARVWQPGQPYEYRQNNMYFVAVKKVVHSAEERLLAAILGLSQSGVRVASYLNHVYLDRSFSRVLERGEHAIGLKLEGEPSDLEGVTTTAPLEQILRDVVNHAASNWDEGDANPLITLRYELQGHEILLQMQVRTQREKKPDEILRKGTLQVARNAGVQMQYSSELKSRMYEFRMPVAVS